MQFCFNLLSFHGPNELAYSSQIWVVSSNNRLPEEARDRDKQPVFPCMFTLDAALQKALATAWRETKVALEALTQAQ